MLTRFNCAAQIFIAATLLSAITATAQVDQAEALRKNLALEVKDTTYWAHGGVLSLGLNQGFLHNWPAGGELVSATINGQFSGYLNRFYHRHIWTNNLDVSYGLFYAYSNGFVPRKLDDRVDLTSKYGLELGNGDRFYLTGLLNFRTQITDGYDYSAANFKTRSTSGFFSPAYITGALGVEYRKGNKLSTFLSPAAARFTIVRRQYTLLNDEGAFGVPFGETSRFELGAYFSGRFMTEIEKKFLFRTRLDLYANYLAKDIKDGSGTIVKRDNPGNIDILWDNFISVKINRYLGATMAATFVYDNDIPYAPAISPGENEEPGNELGWWQVKQILSIGLEYRF